MVSPNRVDGPRLPKVNASELVVHRLQVTPAVRVAVLRALGLDELGGYLSGLLCLLGFLVLVVAVDYVLLAKEVAAVVVGHHVERKWYVQAERR